MGTIITPQTPSLSLNINKADLDIYWFFEILSKMVLYSIHPVDEPAPVQKLPKIGSYVRLRRHCFQIRPNPRIPSRTTTPPRTPTKPLAKGAIQREMDSIVCARGGIP